MPGQKPGGGRSFDFASISGGVNGTLPGDTYAHRAAGSLQPGHDDEGLVGSIVSIQPFLGYCRIEKLSQKPVKVNVTVLRFEHACTLKIGETLEFVSR
ncbi:MAG: hypothetical protein KGN84_12305 [Acidobacteriota bacterium]|nr:hypothetical protein [Acidobacteriota bacterium]